MQTRVTKMIQRLILLFSIAIISSSALADSDHNEARKLKEAGEILPLEQIIAHARRQHAGHILEIELEREDDRYIYELEMLDDGGTIWELKYDAKSGSLIKHEMDD